MKKHLLQMGLSQREVDGVEGDIVLHIIETTYRHFLKIWSIHKPETWAYYKHMEYETLREMKELRKAERLVKGDWRSAYAQCKKDSEQKRQQSHL